jgi:hypothetical protein
MRASWKLAGVLATALMLSACGGSDNPTNTATSDTTVAVNGASVSALAAQGMTFAGGVSEFGTTADTTVALSGGASPAFTIGDGTGTASGPLAFGSCIFKITASTFPAASPLGVGKTVTLHPCNLNAATAAATADGLPADRDVRLVLGTHTSSPRKLVVVISADGTVTISGTSVGSVTVKPVTGA